MLVLPKWTDKRINMLLWKLRNLPAEARWRVSRLRNAMKTMESAICGGEIGITSKLALRVFRSDGSIEDYGVVGRRVVTRTGVDLIVKDFASVASNDVSEMNFHGIGTGTTAEASTQTALVTELTTQYNPDNTRATGVQSNPASSGDSFFYLTVGTNEVDAAVAITEHGLFNQAATGGGVMLDRTLFSVVNLASGDKMESRYTLTVTANG